jgi:hypothetical protein
MIAPPPRRGRRGSKLLTDVDAYKLTFYLLNLCTPALVIVKQRSETANRAASVITHMVVKFLDRLKEA